VRSGDRALPLITLDPDACAAWPVRPVIALESSTGPGWQWDNGLTWDTAGLVWDEVLAAPQWVDATCDFTGADIDYGPADESGAFPAGRLAATLDNRSGRWAPYNLDGSPAAFGAGQRVAAWWTDRHGSSWWAFYGRIATYDEHMGDLIELEAFDTLADLNQDIGDYTPGAAGQTPGPRLTAIVTAAQAPLVRTRFAAGTVTLTAQQTDQSPLEEMQTVATSDGGVLYGDADGTVVFEPRTWRVGRSDQTAVPVLGTNVCTAPIVLTDPVLTTSDEHLAGVVRLENVAGLVAVASRQTDPRYVYAETDQQWTTQLEGDTLAGYLAANMWQARLGLSSGDVYPLDPRTTAMLAAADWRLLDRVRILHDSRTAGGTARIDVEALVVELHHALTAETWVCTLGTTRALAYYAPQIWDQSAFTWDDPSPLNVWGYAP
jgi:hypothetical protein